MLQAFRLQPRPGAGFHFGRQGRDIESSTAGWESDSLFAALLATWRDLGGEPSALAEPFVQGRPPFVLSSLFPVAGDLPLLPMPRLPVRFDGPDLPALKKLKKLRYVSPAILRRLLAGQAMDGQWQRDARQPTGPHWSLQGGAAWLSEEERPLLPAAWRRLPPAALAAQVLWEINAVPRVTVDRTTAAGNIYRAGRTVYAAECGLWCLAQVEARGGDLVTLLEELGLRGIGGERSAGYGAFTLHPLAALPELPPAARAPRVMTLSRYLPQDEEVAAGVLGPDAAYELVQVGGWLHSPDAAAQRRRRIRMIEAGSVLAQPAGTPLVGRMVDVRPVYAQAGAPPHPVYRAGFALLVGVER